MAQPGIGGGGGGRWALTACMKCAHGGVEEVESLQALGVAFFFSAMLTFIVPHAQKNAVTHMV